MQRHSEQEEGSRRRGTFLRIRDRSMAHILLPVSTHRDRDTSQETTGPQALGFMTSQRFPALGAESWTTGTLCDGGTSAICRATRWPVTDTPS